MFPIYVNTVQRIVKFVLCEHVEEKVVFPNNQRCSLKRNTAKVNWLPFWVGLVAWCIGAFHTPRVYWSQQINLQNFPCHISCSKHDESAPKGICSWLSNRCGVTAILGSINRCAVPIKREIMVSLVIKINRTQQGPWLSSCPLLPTSVLWRGWKNGCASFKGSGLKKLDAD